MRIVGQKQLLLLEAHAFTVENAREIIEWEHDTPCTYPQAKRVVDSLLRRSLIAPGPGPSIFVATPAGVEAMSATHRAMYREAR
jgi:hypothetical protein